MRDILNELKLGKEVTLCVTGRKIREDREDYEGLSVGIKNPNDQKVDGYTFDYGWYTVGYIDEFEDFDSFQEAISFDFSTGPLDMILVEKIVKDEIGEYTQTFGFKHPQKQIKISISFWNDAWTESWWAEIEKDGKIITIL